MTIKEALQRLPKEVSKKAIRNTKAKKLAKKRESLREALISAFVWRNSPEGYKYWSEIYEKHRYD